MNFSKSPACYVSLRFLRNQRSIVMQASEEFECNDTLIDHYWCLVTSLHLVMLGNMKSVKPRSLFDTKVRMVDYFHA